VAFRVNHVEVLRLGVEVSQGGHGDSEITKLDLLAAILNELIVLVGLLFNSAIHFDNEV